MAAIAMVLDGKCSAMTANANDSKCYNDVQCNAQQQQ